MSANITQNAQRTTFDFFDFSKDQHGSYFISLFQIAVPIFDGGARNAKIASAKIDLLKTNNNLDQLKSSIDNDVSQSRINMKSALLTMDVRRKI